MFWNTICSTLGVADNVSFNIYPNAMTMTMYDIEEVEDDPCDVMYEDDEPRDVRVYVYGDDVEIEEEDEEEEEDYDF